MNNYEIIKDGKTVSNEWGIWYNNMQKVRQLAPCTIKQHLDSGAYCNPIHITKVQPE